MEEANITTTPEQPTVAAEKKRRGGYRQGAGRKCSGRAKKKSVTIRLPIDLISFLDMQKNKSLAVENALRSYCKENGISL